MILVRKWGFYFLDPPGGLGEHAQEETAAETPGAMPFDLKPWVANQGISFDTDLHRDTDIGLDTGIDIDVDIDIGGIDIDADVHMGSSVLLFLFVLVRATNLALLATGAVWGQGLPLKALECFGAVIHIADSDVPNRNGARMLLRV